MKIETKRQFKDELYAQFARMGKALSNPHRLELLELLTQGERTVEDLAGEANLPIANACFMYGRPCETWVILNLQRSIAWFKVFSRTAGR